MITPDFKSLGELMVKFAAIDATMKQFFAAQKSVGASFESFPQRLANVSAIQKDNSKITALYESLKSTPGGFEEMASHCTRLSALTRDFNQFMFEKFLKE